MPSQHAIGIDLGTTNSELAYASIAHDPGDAPKVELLPVPQLVAASTVESRSMLPSFMYLGTQQDVASKALGLPWEKNPPYAVGAFAQKQAADVPTRTVAAAKSWLANT